MKSSCIILSSAIALSSMVVAKPVPVPYNVFDHVSGDDPYTMGSKLHEMVAAEHHVLHIIHPDGSVRTITVTPGQITPLPAPAGHDYGSHLWSDGHIVQVNQTAAATHDALAPSTNTSSTVHPLVAAGATHVEPKNATANFSPTAVPAAAPLASVNANTTANATSANPPQPVGSPISLPGDHADHAAANSTADHHEADSTHTAPNATSTAAPHDASNNASAIANATASTSTNSTASTDHIGAANATQTPIAHDDNGNKTNNTATAGPGDHDHDKPNGAGFKSTATFMTTSLVGLILAAVSATVLL